MQVLLVEPDQAAQGCADAAANLQRCALPPGGAATQMGQDGADEDQRRHFQGDLVLRADGVEHEIRPLVMGDAAQPVQGYDDKPRQRQQIE